MGNDQLSCVISPNDGLLLFIMVDNRWWMMVDECLINDGEYAGMNNQVVMVHNDMGDTWYV